MNHGFVKVAAAVPHITVADCRANANQIESLIATAEGKGVEIIVLPELCITGYTCGDLFGQQLLLTEAELALMQIINNTRQLDIISILGMPIIQNSTLFNCAVVIQHGKIMGIVPKTYLPNYKEFYEQRWFTSSREQIGDSIRLCGQTAPMAANLIFSTTGANFGIELCEDVWAPIPPSSNLSLQGAQLIFNLSASDDLIGKYAYLKGLVSQQSARCLGGYIYASCGFGESTTDLVFSGKGLIFENGKLLAESERFSMKEVLIISEIDIEKLDNERRINTTFPANAAENKAQFVRRVAMEPTTSHELELTRPYNPLPFVPTGPALDENCEEAFSIQVAGLAKRLVHTHAHSSVIGISGGLDSTLALLVTAQAYDQLNWPREEIIGVTMPGFGTTDRTYQNAIDLIKKLGITLKEISIKEAVIQHFKDIEHDINVQDVTYENSQARERTQILMDVANATGGLVIGTGDLSELALGWATYNGDHMSMYGVNASIPKTLVRHLVKWVSEKMDEQTRNILLDIIDTPISPELIPADENGEIAQKTEDLVGPYELHDFYLYNFLRHGFRPSKIYFLAHQAFGQKYDSETIKRWLTVFFRRFFAQQFKRSCLPDGPKVGSIAVSPRGDWRMPSDASAALWLNEIENL